MKWKKYFTAEEAALFSADVTLWPSFRSFESSEVDWAFECSAADWDREYKKVAEAREIYEALIDESSLAYDITEGSSQLTSPIDITHYKWVEDDPGFFPNLAKMSRESIGVWFWQCTDIGKAVMFNVNAESDYLAFKASGQENRSDTVVHSAATVRTPQDNLLEAVGLMAILLVDKSPKFSRNEKPNAKQIAEEIQGMATQKFGLEVFEKSGLSNLNRDIAEGVKAVSIRIKGGNG